ncbi:MAG: tetratricopeptide repeat protein [Halodesulfovibrio sp.]
MKRTTTSFAATIMLAALLGGCMGSNQETGPSMSLMERYHSGQSLMGNDRNLTAEPEQQNLTKDQADARESFMRGLAYANQGREELALEQYSRAAMQDPTLMQARYQRGLLLLEKQLPAPALEEFKAVMQLSPDFAPGYASAGRVYFLNGLYPEAEKLFDKALQIDPELLDAYDHLGAIHNYNKQYEKALGTFQKALMINPNASYLYNNLGLAYSMLGRDADAVESFRKAVMQGAPSPKAYNNMGLALCRLGKYREGLEAFRAASGEAAGWTNLGYFFVLDGQYTRAIKSFEKAIELEPTYYERAAENLKRARLAAQFADNSEASQARPYSQDDLFAPRPPTVPSSTFPLMPPQIVPTSVPTSGPTSGNVSGAVSGASSSSVSSVQEQNLTEPGMVQLAPPVRRPAASTAAAQAPVKDNGEKAASSATSNAGATYALHVSSFRTRAAAEADAAKLHARNLNTRVVTVHIPGKGEWFRVLVNSFASAQEARNALVALQATHTDFADTRVVNASSFTGTAQDAAPVAQPVAAPAALAALAALAAQTPAVPSEAADTASADNTAAAAAGSGDNQIQAVAHAPAPSGSMDSMRVPTALMLQP